MTLPDLYKQQAEEIAQFNAMRNNTWAELQEKQQAIIEAFGSRKNLPDSMRKQFDEQTNEYNREWAIDTGERHIEITGLHIKQREQLTGKSVTPKPANANSDKFSEKQAQLQKIIKQQQAIRKQNEEKTRKR